MATITDAARDALRDATMTDTTLTLPQVDRKVYAELKQLIERTGGKWVRKLATHVYETDPRPVIEHIVATGEMPRDADKDAAFFRTPKEVADRLAYCAGLLDPRWQRVLEPSAGDGALAKAARDVYSWRALEIVCVEPDAGRHAKLLDSGFKAEQSTFEEYAATEPEPFDAVLMNPPFAVAGHPVLWAEHVLLAWGLLKEGGKLAAVVPNNLTRGLAPIRQVQALVKAHGYVQSLPEGSFKESGTGVHTVIVALER